jgi:hypothetical protein
MKRVQKKNPVRKRANQLSLDFSSNVPIEIHIPKFEIPNFRISIMPERKQEIQLIVSETISYPQQNISYLNPRDLTPQEAF